jgi:hypothetical protein
MQDAWNTMIAASHTDHRDGIRSIIILVLWELWTERNARIFKEKASTLRQLMHRIQDEANGWAFAGAKKLQRLIWEPP